MAIYNSMKKLIGKHFYATAEEAQTKLDTFYATNRLTDAQYNELTSLVEAVYGTENEA